MNFKINKKLTLAIVCVIAISTVLSASIIALAKWQVYSNGINPNNSLNTSVSSSSLSNLSSNFINQESSKVQTQQSITLNQPEPNQFDSEIESILPELENIKLDEQKEIEILSELEK